MVLIGSEEYNLRWKIFEESLVFLFRFKEGFQQHSCRGVQNRYHENHLRNKELGFGMFGAVSEKLKGTSAQFQHQVNNKKKSHMNGIV